MGDTTTTTETQQNGGSPDDGGKILLEQTLSHESEKKMLEDDDDDDRYDDDDDQKQYQCGVQDCRPGWMQPLANLKCFTLALSVLMIFGSMNFTYYVAVLTQIEREFGLSSTMTGFIKNIDNIGYMSTVLVVTHFCRYSNKPRLFSAANIIGGTAVFLFAVPYFIYGSSNSVGSGILVQGENDTSFEQPNVCTRPDGTEDDISGLDDGGQCGSGGGGGGGRGPVRRPFNAGALAFFVVSELLQGMSSSPKYALTLTYMDDNSKKSSPAYFGFLFGMRAFAPVLGFALGGWANSIYVDLTSPDISQKDPRWVGAWWLGFMVCGTCSFVLAIPLVLFPAKFKEDKSQAEARAKKMDVAAQFKDLPKALLRLLKNPVYVCMISASCFNFFLMGFSSFTPKYLETYFGLTASRASLLTGMIALFSFCLGPIISGQVTARIKFGVAGALKVVMATNALAAVGFAIMMFLECPDKEFSGSVKDLDFTTTCNANCTCSSYDYKPVCADGKNYFSPCHVGCTQEISDPITNVKTYEGCSCVESQTAAEGLCDKGCGAKFIIYLAVMAISKFAASMTIVPYLTVLMRSAPDKDKGVALGLSSAIGMIVSFPSPMLFGLAIDHTCLIYQSSCDRKGACLFYDSTRFRLAFHGIAVFIKVCAFLLYSLALYVNYRQGKKQPEKRDSIVKTLNEEDLKEKAKFLDDHSGDHTEKQNGLVGDTEDTQAV